MITGRQIRKGRTLAGISMFRLARDTKLDLTTIARAEAADGEPSITKSQAAKIQGVLAKAGIEFLNHGQPGVQLRKAED